MQLLKYTLIRLGVFLVVFLALWWALQWPIFISGIIGIVVAFAVSYLFLNKLRLAANADVSKAFNKNSASKTKKQLADEEFEDSLDEARRRQNEA